MKDFVERAYIPDVVLAARYYKGEGLAGIGGGAGGLGVLHVGEAVALVPPVVLSEHPPVKGGKNVPFHIGAEDATLLRKAHLSSLIT